MKAALNQQAEMGYAVPEDIVSVRIDLSTGLLAIKNDYSTRFEYFIKGSEPAQLASADAAPVVYDHDASDLLEEEDEIFN